MSGDSENSILKTVASIQRSFDGLNVKLLEALARLDEATTRISALSEIHVRLTKTIMDVLGIPEELGSPLAFSAPMEAITSAQRDESRASGLLRPIIKSLRKSCGDIAHAINTSKEEILKVTGSFDFTEMEILAREFQKDPDRFLGSDEQEAFRNKIREWTLHLKDALSG
jgi:DNA-binding SARP family transcriptional activator